MNPLHPPTPMREPVFIYNPVTKNTLILTPGFHECPECPTVHNLFERTPLGRTACWTCIRKAPTA